ncbi:MAG TPA: TonB-dependent receptor [Gemmatimonadales bacterium]|jgi:iron complex outermembrane receptor protein|nr:TonB-dependent receptor [Gemmatimonadales bacterium]
MRTSLLVALGCFAWALPALGQTGIIEGIVVDSASGAPLSGVQVTALDQANAVAATVRTDGRGRFRLTKLAAAPFTLVFTRIDHTVRRIEGVTPADSGTPLEIVLDQRGVVLDPVQITASRVAETTLDAPVSVSVVSRREIEEATAFTPLDHLPGVPGMDFVSTGLIQRGFAVRGRNGPNQGFLLMMADYRNAALPSLGSNVSYLLPFTNEDLERIEVVRGPGAALYGPDAHRGVVHFVTRSPFESPGTTLSIAGGERSVLQATARFAAAPSARIAFKISGDYFQGRDWELAAADEALRRDKGARRAGGEARLDWRLDSVTTVVVSAGAAQAINVVAVTGAAGPVQVRDWRSSFAQARLRRGRLFANVLYNVSDAGETHQLRTGTPIVDNSRQVALQLQQETDAGRYDLLYGLDGRWTDPRTGGTIHGVNEDDDRVVEIGGYVQTRTALSPRLDFVTAVRVDRNNRLDDLSVSPRAGVVFRPAPAHSFRLTYNRAFSSPDPAQLFMDLNVGSLPGGYALRLSSIPRSGYSFRWDCSGICMRSPFDTANTARYLPADATQLWDRVVAIVAGDSLDLSDIPAPTASQVATDLAAYNRQTRRFDPIVAADIGDFAPLRRSSTHTLELGYKGVLTSRVLVTVDGYVSRVNDPFGTSFAATPNVFHDSTTLAQYLSAYRPPATAAQLAGAIAKIPVGTISPRETSYPYDILFLQRQGGAYTVWGMDVSFTASLSSRTEVTGTYSWANRNILRDIPVVDTIFLNVPQDKGAVTMRYRNERIGLTAALQGRAVGAFPVRSGVVTADIASYALVDAHVGYQLERASGIGFSLDAYNLLDHRHREIGGGGRLGRLVVSRVQVRF